MLKRNLVFKIFLFLILIYKLGGIGKPTNEEVINKTLTNQYQNTKENYTLIIPKINIFAPFYKDNEKLNSVDYGLMYIKPQNDNRGFMLASHSGSADISLFKRLEELQINDEVYIKTNNQIATYKITSKNYKEKDGTLKIDFPNNKYLVLITCSKIKLNQQVYYLAIFVK